jgi:hypothetical protein
MTLLMACKDEEVSLQVTQIFVDSRGLGAVFLLMVFIRCAKLKHVGHAQQRIGLQFLRRCG